MNELGGRILEIGDRTLFFRARPESTTLIWTGLDPIETAPGVRNFSPKTLAFLARALKSGEFDTVVCHLPLHDPRGVKWLGRCLGRRPWRLPSDLFRTRGALWPARLSIHPNTSLIALDTDDNPFLFRHQLGLLARCDVCFKRELPVDLWRVFSPMASANLPNARFRKRENLRRTLTKLRPISLGLDPDKLARIDSALTGGPVEKTVDIFFAGATDSSSVRADGLAQLRKLASEGYVVDIPDERIGADEFSARCARAWLAFSPEGYGWDCFRHYEAAACGSVALINSPTIRRHCPLLEGVHALYYTVDGDDLAETVRCALADKPRLREIAARARVHVRAHHTHEEICRYVLRATGAAGVEIE